MSPLLGSLLLFSCGAFLAAARSCADGKCPVSIKGAALVQTKQLLSKYNGTISRRGGSSDESSGRNRRRRGKGKKGSKKSSKKGNKKGTCPTSGKIYVAPPGSVVIGTGEKESPFTYIDDAVGCAKPGDSILLLPGEYKNTNFGKSNIWKEEDTLRIWNLQGSPGKYITIRPDQPGTVTVKCDGSVALTVKNAKYVRIEGFNIVGEVENIPLALAEQNKFVYKDSNGNVKFRVPPGTLDQKIEKMKFKAGITAVRPSYFNTKGLLVHSSSYVEVVNNIVAFMPGTGLRLQGCDQITVRNNTVHDCSRRSSAGTHGFVIHTAQNMDGSGGVHFLLEGNVIYNNYNEIYSWSTLKNFIHTEIDEGKGLTVQKTANSWNQGKARIVIRNNVCYGNGFSGIHVNQGANVDVYHNTVYQNLRSGRGTNLGISFAPCDDCNVMNNVAVAKNSWGGNALSTSGGTSTWEHNLFIGNLDKDIGQGTNTPTQDVGFEDASQHVFRLTKGSPAINDGVTGYAEKDIDGKPRDQHPDIGAYEFRANSGHTIKEGSTFN